MFTYNITINQDLKLDKKVIDKIFICISNIVTIKQEWSLNIVFLDWESIKNLNNKYRKINKTTDVLSFHYYDDFSDLKKDDIAWEIIMSQERIRLQAIEYWLWEEWEFYKLLIHSILHILWYDHEKTDEYKIMSELENKIWTEVFEK